MILILQNKKNLRANVPHLFLLRRKFVGRVDELRHVMPANNKTNLSYLLFRDFSNDGREFGGSIYQRCNDRLETGVQLSWASGSNATKFGIAAKYDLDQDAAVRAKVNNASQIGLGYQQKLRDGKQRLS